MHCILLHCRMMVHVPISIYLSDLHTGCPKILRTDPGTENSIVAIIQPALRHSGSDNFAGSNSHRYGKSPSNQVTVVLW